MSRAIPAVSLILILIVGSGLRIWATGGDMWIDEVWSLDQMRVAASSETSQDWIALFFHSNTHALNTLHMRLIDGWFGTTATPFAYRSLSLLSGILSIALIAWWGWKRSPALAVIMTMLFAFSYPMINYSGEARGYGPMVLAILVASSVLKNYLETPTTRTAGAFSLISLLGLMSHLTFVVVQAGLGFWALTSIYKNRRNIISTTAQLVPLFGLQLLAISGFGAIAFNNMVRGGDCCPEPALDSIRIMMDWTFGLDANEIGSLLPLLILTALIMFAVFKLAQQGDYVWVALSIVVLVFPLTTLIIETRPDVIHRYYLPSAVFALLVVGGVLTRMWQGGSWKKWICGAALVLFCIGNANLLVKFSDGMRGQYGQVIRMIATSSPAQQRISGFPKFSVSTLVRHQIKILGLDERLKFVDQKDEKSNPADWYINGYLDGQLPEPEITRNLAGAGSVTYSLINIYPSWGLSGDTWALYEKISR